MAWSAFSAEAVELDCELRKLHDQGRTSDALELIKAALSKAHEHGPSNETYDQFQDRIDAV